MLLSPGKSKPTRSTALAVTLLAAGLLFGPSGVARAEKSPLLIPSERFNVDLGDSVIPVVLEPVDNQALIDEDRAEAQASGIGPQRNGIVRPVFQMGMSDPVALEEIPGAGSLWIAGFRSLNAEGIRLHLTGADLPPGAELWVYDPQYPQFAQGPFEGRGPAGNGDIWSTIFVGDLVYVEYFVPAGLEDPGYFVTEELVHMYRPLGPPSGDPQPREGTCHLDVMCYPDYQPLHNATVRLDWTQGAYQYNCCGTQLATVAHDETPYLLTANHCLDSSTYLNSLVSTWFYQSIDCDGYVPPFSSRPKSSRAQFLVTRPDAYGDQTLLMITGVVPDQAEWADWDTGEVVNGTNVAGIHHPTGAYKRISFGGRTTQTFGNPEYFHGVLWQAGGGTIEPGSSGSGLYRQDNKLLVGVASSSAVGTDCDNHPWGPCSYGKFDRFYPFIDTLLEVGSDDGFEENDSCAAAVDVPNGTYTGTVVKRLDEDWYHFFLTTGSGLTVNLTFTDSEGDIDMELHQGCGGPVVADSTSSTNNESLSYTNAGADDDFYLRVYLADDVRATYTFNVDSSCIAPNAPAGVSASDAAYCSHISVAWNAVSGATSYNVYRNTVNDGGGAQLVGSATESPYDDYDVVIPSQVYYYWVTAVNGCGESAFGFFDTGLAYCDTVIGDMNCQHDGVNAYDIDGFVAAIGNPEDYRAAYPDCNYMLADCNLDGAANAYDIDAFIDLIGGG